MYTPIAYYIAGGIFMFNDILVMAFSLWGVIALLFTFIFKMTVWRIENFTITLPLYKNDKSILNTIYNIRSFFELCSIEKKCTVVLVNYGAPDWFCSDIIKMYEKYNFVKIVSPENISDTIKALHT